MCLWNIVSPRSLKAKRISESQAAASEVNFALVHNKATQGLDRSILIGLTRHDTIIITTWFWRSYPDFLYKKCGSWGDFLPLGKFLDCCHESLHRSTEIVECWYNCERSAGKWKSHALRMYKKVLWVFALLSSVIFWEDLRRYDLYELLTTIPSQ